MSYFDPATDAALIARSLIDEAARHGIRLVRLRGADEVPPTARTVRDHDGAEYAVSRWVDAWAPGGRHHEVQHCGATPERAACWYDDQGREIRVAEWIERGAGL